MQYIKLLYVALGVALVVLVVVAFDFQRALALVGSVSGIGVAGLLSAYLLVFLLDTWLWQLCLPAVPGSPIWFLRLARVRLVGEAYNDVMPAAGLGGEPVKVVLLKARYGVPSIDSTVSLVLFRTITLLGQLLFLALAFALMAVLAELPAEIGGAAGLGLALLFAMAVGLVGAPRWRLLSRFGRWLGQRRRGDGLARILAEVEAAEIQIAKFRGDHPVRFFALLALSLAQWLAGALEIWLALRLLGHPVGIEEAIVIEALVQAVRTASFFIPANLGAQDGAVVLVSAAFTGAPAVGLSAAILRRLRHLVWILLGFVSGGHYAWRAWREGTSSRAEMP